MCVCVCVWIDRQIDIYTKVGRKIHRLNQIFLWNVTKYNLLFNIAPLLFTHLIHWCCSAWFPLVKESPKPDMTLSYKNISQCTYQLSLVH